MHNFTNWVVKSTWMSVVLVIHKADLMWGRSGVGKVKMKLKVWVCYSCVLKRCWEFPSRKIGFYCSLIPLLPDKGAGLVSQTVCHPCRMWGVETKGVQNEISSFNWGLIVNAIKHMAQLWFFFLCQAWWASGKACKAKQTVSTYVVVSRKKQMIK